MKPLSELRTDLLTGRQVIIAPGREGRPTNFAPVIEQQDETDCPFCPGNESATPPEIVEYSDGKTSGTSDWRARVIPNKYPAIEPTDSASRLAGYHELLIESPFHVASFSELTTMEQRRAIAILRDRYSKLSQRPGIKHIQIFKNVGRDGGASVQHTHSQIIALNFIPPMIAQMHRRAADHFNSQGNDLVDNMIADDVAQGRAVLETENIIAVCPFASRFAYETWIAPKQDRRAAFSESSDALLHEIASAMHSIVASLESLPIGPAYNIVLNTPRVCASPPAFGWFFQIFPRVTQFAGFEWATDCYINTVAPEIAAETLRAAMTSFNPDR